uniref:Uncharacterized protein n=1 Tax=viral metagenome TaxID=1070528 RepID=A0A6C0LLE1_9ZZZZ
MSSGKKVCLNCSTSYYTGKEQSPLHFGLSAEGYEINSIMEGFDKDLWIVEVRNGKKVWTKKEHINKMTFEIPLINETTLPITLSAHAEPDIQPPSTEKEQPAVSVEKQEPCITITQQQEDAPHTPHTPQTSDIDTTKSKEKVSKTVKPTDYTLFITYRIHQMKTMAGASSDNKKNYDCARYEWKEYKNKPDELRLIMVEANKYHGSK